MSDYLPIVMPDLIWHPCVTLTSRTWLAVSHGPRIKSGATETRDV